MTLPSPTVFNTLHIFIFFSSTSRYCTMEYRYYGFTFTDLTLAVINSGINSLIQDTKYEERVFIIYIPISIME